MNDPLATCRAALKAAADFREAAKAAVAGLVAPGGKLDPTVLEREQYAAHGFAWLATYVAALEALLAWAERLEAAGDLRGLERLTLQLGFAEYLQQMTGGIALSQVEASRPADLGLDAAAVARLRDDPAVVALAASGGGAPARLRLAELLAAGREAGDFGALGLDDETLQMIREQFRRFANDHMEAAHGWHLRDELIPLAVIEQLGALGVFGLTVPEDWGGAGMGKAAMCVVTEELARGYIGLGSLGTRSEIACELIGQSGTQAQKERWLPGIASGQLQVTAVFTEPNVGSDLGAIQTRAVRANGADGSEVYRITGNKTWITHGARSDLMTLMARTDPDRTGYQGLSMFIAEKPRGTDAEPFPANGMSGGEIGVLGYRGMKEYEIAFDGFEVPAAHLLGEVEGQGFKQLMANLRVGAHPDRGARGRRRPERAGIGPGLRPRAAPVRQAPDRVPARRRQARLDGGRDHDRAPTDPCGGADQGFRPPLRHRGRHGQAAGRAHRLVQRRQRAADPRRQRLRPGVQDLTGIVRCPHPQHLRGRRRNPSPHHRARPVERAELGGF